MGAKSSKEASSFRSTSSSSWGGGGYPQSSYGHETQSYMPPQQQPYSSQPYYTSPPECYGSVDNGRRLDRKYSRIADDYNSLEEVVYKWVFCLNRDGYLFYPCGMEKWWLHLCIRWIFFFTLHLHLLFLLMNEGPSSNLGVLTCKRMLQSGGFALLFFFRKEREKLNAGL